MLNIENMFKTYLQVLEVYLLAKFNNYLLDFKLCYSNFFGMVER